jgi:hypothetical protein
MERVGDNKEQKKRKINRSEHRFSLEKTIEKIN